MVEKDQRYECQTLSSMKVHPSITPERVIAACERRDSSLDNPGFCVNCGVDAEGCEPDAREYECAECGANAVYGAEELLMDLE
jgi:hypothetical protein